MPKKEALSDEKTARKAVAKAKKTRAVKSTSKKKTKTTRKTSSKRPVSKKKSTSKVTKVSVTGNDAAESIAITKRSNRLGLTVRSPFTLPIDYDKVAAQTARLVGMAFVIIGAFFATTNALQMNAGALGLQVANVLCQDPAGTVSDSGDCIVSDGSGSSGEDSNTSDGGGSVEEEVGTSPSTINAEPEVSFEIDAHASQENLVYFYFYVEDANSVAVRVFHTGTNEVYDLGDAAFGEGSEWKYRWDTVQYPEGEYIVKVEVENQFGSYSVSNRDSFSVINTFESEDEGLADEQSGSGVVEDDGGTTAGEESINDLSSVGDAKNDFSDSDTEDSTSDNQEHSTTDSDEPILVTELDEDGDAVITPDIEIAPKKNTLTGRVYIPVKVKEARSVELFATPEFSNRDQYLGKGQKLNPGYWEIAVDTQNLPSGNYKLRAKVTNEFGIYDATYSELVFVENVVIREQTVEEKIAVEKYAKLAKEVDEELEKQSSAVVDLSIDANAVEKTTDNQLESSDNDEPTNDTSLSLDSTVEESFEAQTPKLTGLFQELGEAVRSGDDSGVVEVERKLDRITDQVIDGANIVVDSIDAEEKKREIRRSVEVVIEKQKKERVRKEQIIKNRVGDEVFTDSDEDGISDYDEINLYQTDPFIADSDNDGFVDGAEIENGYNPKDAKPEVLIEYESPKETGIVRNDLLVVHAVKAISSDPAPVTEKPEPSEENRESEETELDIAPPKALISGKALPNSYVTLYIFSTPIVVTVRTDDDGSWNYTFDKELEDGEHEVYVGVTDNAGKIVAKSEPFTFVKTAQAFQPVKNTNEGIVTASIDTETSFFSQNMFLIILSLLVLLIGLILLMLGMHISARREMEAYTNPNFETHAPTGAAT